MAVELRTSDEDEANMLLRNVGNPPTRHCLEHRLLIE